MNEQNRMRLHRIATRHATQTAAFDRVRSEILRPVMEEVGVQLKAEGYDFQIALCGDERTPAIDFHIDIPARSDSKDTIRFFLRPQGQGEGLAGDWRARSQAQPGRAHRFEALEQITRDRAEQLVVDAVEQMFSSTEGRR
jgi:hypothetical protein